jgi:UDP-N-acetylmuramate dehydrogenase
MSVMEANSLLDRLPNVRGRLTANAPLAERTWFRVGGPAELLFRPADREDLAEFLAGCPLDVPLTVLGAASNVLVRDGGVPGVVIRLTTFSQITHSSPRGLTTGPRKPSATELDEGVLGPVVKPRDDNEEIITAEAGALDATIAQFAQQHSLTGLEFLSGIPGSIGGAVVMNAGAYGNAALRTESRQIMISDVLVSADVLLRNGTIVIMTAKEMGLSYRHSALPEGAIVLSAKLRAKIGDPATIAQYMAEIDQGRLESQPTRARTGGSTFANPPGLKAWQLIDAAGCRGLTIGGAQMSAQHCNFMLNTGDATAADLENLGEEVRRRVFATSGVDLRWEIKRLGVPR